MRTSSGLRVALAFAALLVGNGAAESSQQQPLMKTAAITYQGTVTEVDYPNRILTTQGLDGRLATFEVPTTVPDPVFNSLVVGDVVQVTYSDAISFRRKAAGEPAVDTRDPATRLRLATVRVSAVDPMTRTITFTGPKGRDYSRRVVDEANARLLSLVMVGDLLDVSWYETMVLTKIASQVPAVAPPPPPAPGYLPPPAPPVESLRHRFTISALFGWDNQFSGKMLKAGSGTAQGVPIEFFETSFDDVYGRMGLLKVGIGYRISPRSEVTVNYVYSSSGSKPVRVGEVGPLTAPVVASFDDYSYWGFEFGQRFYFTRVRFTPFVGYYAGINRFDEINGDFRAPAVGQAPDLQPGIEINDGEFFDASWAFSFGPTGGLLIGLGPIEVMAQVELRYMGGLSDVDPLSEAGLKDINSESSRWSVPFLFGARIRF